MRSRIKVRGKYFKPMPWLDAGGCKGCELDDARCVNVSDDDADSCADGAEFEGHIFISISDESTAKYVAARLEAAG